MVGRAFEITGHMRAGFESRQSFGCFFVWTIIVGAVNGTDSCVSDGIVRRKVFLLMFLDMDNRVGASFRQSHSHRHFIPSPFIVLLGL